jgi:hypothetical protein
MPPILVPWIDIPLFPLDDGIYTPDGATVGHPGLLVHVRLNIPPDIGGAGWLDFQSNACTPAVLNLRPDDRGIMYGPGQLVLLVVPMLLVLPC